MIISAVGRISGADSRPTIRRGLYFPPVFTPSAAYSAPDDHFTAGPYGCVEYRAVGALVVLVAVQLFVMGLYLPPVFNGLSLSDPPQTIIWLPVHTAV